MRAGRFPLSCFPPSSVHSPFPSVKSAPVSIMFGCAGSGRYFCPQKGIGIWCETCYWLLGCVWRACVRKDVCVGVRWMWQTSLVWRAMLCVGVQAKMWRAWGALIVWRAWWCVCEKMCVGQDSGCVGSKWRLDSMRGQSKSGNLKCGKMWCGQARVRWDTIVWRCGAGVAKQK